MSYKVLYRLGLVKYHKEELSKIDAQFIETQLSTEDDIINQAQDADAVIVGATEPYTEKVIKSLNKCKIISRMGIGWNNIDLVAATNYGIPVAYIPDASISEVSDHAMALLLCFSRRLIPISQAVKAGSWQPGRKDIMAICQGIARLSEQTLGLVGLGRIGSAVCQKAWAFGLRVLVYDPYVSAALILELGAEPADFERILAESDYVSIHAPLTKETRHLFSLEQFKKMKPTSYLINASRGSLVNEEALITALSKGYIAGAGLDVTDPEPPKPDNPLIKMDNVIISAHTAFYSEGSTSELNRRAIGAIVKALNGQWPEYIANPDVRNKTNSRLSRQ